MTTTTAHPRFSLLGNAVRLLRDPLRVLTSLPAYGDVVPVGFGRWQAVVVCDPELARQVMADDRTFDKGGTVDARVRELVGDSLITSRHAGHRRQRRLVQPAFHHTRLPSHVDLMTGQIGAVTGSWRDGQVIDGVAAAHDITTRVICAAVFATEMSADDVAQTARDFNTFMVGVYKRILTPAPLNQLPTPDKRRYGDAIARLRATAAGIIAERRASARDDILSMLLAARDEDGQGMSETELVNQIVMFLVAGVDTTAAGMAWALHLLANHPHIAERVRQEADEVLAGRTATTADLPALAFTSRVVTESLRLYPPAWVLTRIATTATELGGHPVKPGTTVVISPYLIHHRPDVYPDPERFDPDRHGDRMPRSALMPFGAGGRKCIGDTFAMAETTLALATICARWRLRPLPGVRTRPALRLVLAPRSLHLRVVAR